LARQNVDTKILGVESGWMPALYGFKRSENGKTYEDYVDAFCGDPETGPMMNQVICGHTYFSDVLNSTLQAHRRRLRAKLNRYPAWKFWQTEYCVMRGPEGEGGNGRDLGIRTALNVARIIHCDLTLCNASAWQWWTAVSCVNYKDGLIYTDYRKPGDAETVYPSKTLWALGHFSRFIRPGSVRIDLMGARDVHGLMASAYKNDGERTLTVVCVNVGDKDEPVRFDWRRVPPVNVPRSWQPYLTSDQPADDLRALPQAPVTEDFIVPAQSIMTLVGDVGP
jgi:O-glycosyl hydrolase